ncbi:hypothetical protein PFBG_00503 [Plasmodium falciparum 7G8]|uniref:Uncharacterized protein n=1 Tax=Plasmodium falciparum (isolate 7G8) TaxID=57266 RepID=W7FTY7_PLAF8|nr:hypothetical protein PFBG_00503 [Plasmodium falciparum 7G8]
MARSSAVGTQKTVMQIAEQFQQEAKQKANGIYIDKEKHTNDKREYGKGDDKYHRPCTGKDSEGLSGNHVSDLLLDDVLLTAKYEGEYIKK